MFGGLSRTLAAEKGTFTLTGVSADPRKTSLLSASVGAFVLTGKDATLTFGSSAAGSGAPSYLPSIGLLLTFSGTYRLTAIPGVFSVVGKDATSYKGVALFASAGSFTLEGAPGLRDMHLYATKGGFSLTGQDSGVARTYENLVALPGSFVLTGVAAEMTPNFRILSAGTGSFTFTGKAASGSIGNRWGGVSHGRHTGVSDISHMINPTTGEIEEVKTTVSSDKVDEVTHIPYST
jgi:hypothetical protein